MKSSMRNTPIQAIEDIAGKVREAQKRSNALLLADQKKGKRDRMDSAELTQQISAILYSELHPLGLFPEDAFERLYADTLDNDSSEYVEELLFLEHVLRS